MRLQREHYGSGSDNARRLVDRLPIRAILRAYVTFLLAAWILTAEVSGALVSFRSRGSSLVLPHRVIGRPRERYGSTTALPLPPTLPALTVGGSGSTTGARELPPTAPAIVDRRLTMTPRFIVDRRLTMGWVVEPGFPDSPINATLISRSDS